MSTSNDQNNKSMSEEPSLTADNKLNSIDLNSKKDYQHQTSESVAGTGATDELERVGDGM